MIRWEETPVPAGVAAILSGRLPDDGDLEAALDYADRFQLTLTLDVRTPRVERARARNVERNARMLQALGEILEAAGERLPFVVLKGFTHAGLFPLPPDQRIQYDLDLFSPGNEAGFRHIVRRFAENARHYRWNGDYYDPNMPVYVDWHERLWDGRMEGFGAPGIEEFWERRVWMEAGGLRFQTLAPADAVGFAALHMLKHILHGDARPVHAYEMAAFLRHHAEGDGFWAEWRRLHRPELRMLEGISFRFAAEWFGCGAPPEARELPEAVEQWFGRFRASPIVSYFRPNKDELALNLCLAESGAARARVAARRLLPVQWPRPLSYALARAGFHLRALGPALGTLWRMRRR